MLGKASLAYLCAAFVIKKKCSNMETRPPGVKFVRLKKSCKATSIPSSGHSNHRSQAQPIRGAGAVLATSLPPDHQVAIG